MKSAKATFISEYYIGILGKEYGTASKDNLSATEQEFREAQKTNKEVLIFIKGKDDTKRDKRIQKLISEIKDENTGYKYKRFNNTLELKIAFMKV